MPWPYMKGLTDGEIRAMLLYILSVPAKKSGRSRTGTRYLLPVTGGAGYQIVDSSVAGFVGSWR